jgi:hypothetical protein
MRRTLTLTAIVLLLLSVVGMTTLQASSAYADPQFKTQWDQGEAITPNFWGPLSTAKDGQQEPYKEASGGQRLVQYFDKGRMELTNGKVTNGLLATEIIKGQIQVGDATFKPQAPPAIPIAGDPDNPGPTYASLATKAASLLAASTSKIGTPVAATVSAAGDVTNPTATATPPTTIGAFDDVTKHNVPQAFADYRAKAGLQTIGYGISEPFMATVKVAGAQKQVMIQVFERRVLTYTASNAPAFQVEMGNIGQHYYQWRYPNGAQAAPAASSATPSNVASAGALPTASAPSTTGGFGVTLSDVLSTVKVGDIQTVNITTNPKVGCGIDLVYAGNVPSKPIQPKQTDDQGKASLAWAIGSEAKPGNATFTVNCVAFGGTSVGTANGSFTVSG